IYRLRGSEGSDQRPSVTEPCSCPSLPAEQTPTPGVAGRTRCYSDWHDELGEWPSDWWWRKRGTREDVTLPDMAARIDARRQLLRSLDAFSHHHRLEIVAQVYESSDKREAPRTRT